MYVSGSLVYPRDVTRCTRICQGQTRKVCCLFLEQFYGNIVNTENYNLEYFDNIDLRNFTLQTAPELVILRVSSFKSTFSCTFGFILDAFLVSG